MDEQLVAVLDLVLRKQPISAARLAKKLGLAQSQLNRLITSLSEDPANGGLGLLEIEVIDRRTLLRLSPKAVAWLETVHETHHLAH